MYLFVYGTLRRGSPHPMARFLAERARYVGIAKIRGKLYDLGRYPGLVPASEAWAIGDVYELPDGDATLAELDRYENGPAPRLIQFERAQVEVTLADGTTLAAWVYWYRGGVQAAQPIASGDYLLG